MWLDLRKGVFHTHLISQIWQAITYLVDELLTWNLCWNIWKWCVKVSDSYLIQNRSYSSLNLQYLMCVEDPFHKSSHKWICSLKVSSTSASHWIGSYFETLLHVLSKDINNFIVYQRTHLQWSSKASFSSFSFLFVLFCTPVLLKSSAILSIHHQ